MSEEEKNTEENEVTALPTYMPVSFAKVLGIVFIVLGVASAIGAMVLYDDLTMMEQDQYKGTYFAAGAGALLGNLAVGSILITLDRIAKALELQNDK